MERYIPMMFQFMPITLGMLYLGDLYTHIYIYIVELVGAPGSSLSSSNQRYTKALPSRKARRHAFYGYQHGRTDPNRGYPSPRCVAPEPHLQRWWSNPHWMIPWQTTHCTEHPIPSQAGGLGVHKTTIYIYIYTYVRTYSTVNCVGC